MITSIALIMASFVALNFLLLAFSCNKTVKKEVPKVKPVKKDSALLTSQLETHELAPTGS